MSVVFSQIESFLLKFCPSSSPLLLALSGGPDSLCLFYALLLFRERYHTPFHIAHIDHRWRQESQEEAETLHQLALQHQVPFHLKVLNPSLLKGNLEAACREERYTFFAQLCQQIPFQGVLTGHHRDDQAETIFKRILEGAHWSRWSGLQSENWIQGIRILRPLLGVTKNDIQKILFQENIQAFEDPSNRHLQFLRARLRETIFPRLSEEFGKQVQNSLAVLGAEAQELIHYFDARLTPLLKQGISGPWGIFFDLQSQMPESLLEMKYLLRLLCKQEETYFSREIIELAAQALRKGKANQFFSMRSNQIWIDRQRIFMLPSPFVAKESQILQVRPGTCLLGDWKLNILEDVYLSSHQATSWKEGWRGGLRGYLPIGNYLIGTKKLLSREIVNTVAIKKRWNQAKVPAFLYFYFPLIWGEEGICHEFLTGKTLCSLNEGTPCWKVELTYSKTE